MCKSCLSRGNSVYKGLELGSKGKMNLMSIDKFSIARGICDALQGFSILSWRWKAFVGFEVGEEGKKIKLACEKEIGKWAAFLGCLCPSVSWSLSEHVNVATLITSRKGPIPTQNVLWEQMVGNSVSRTGEDRNRIGGDTSSPGFASLWNPDRLSPFLFGTT